MSLLPCPNALTGTCANSSSLSSAVSFAPQKAFGAPSHVILTGQCRRREAQANLRLSHKLGATDARSALDAFRADLPKMSPKMAASLDPSAVTS
jgi:hypothetical protein